MKHWFNREPAPPAWASFWDGAQYARFLELVKAEMTRRGLQFRMGDGVVHVLDASGGTKTNDLGLQNVAQKCRSASETAWPDILRGHFEQVIGSGRDEIDEAMAREGLNRAQFKANYAGRVGNWHPVKTSLTGNDR